MRSVALLRGINVGGKNKVDMATLRTVFERAGAEDVSTYINSGNVIFSHTIAHSRLNGVLEAAIEEQFGLRLKVVLRDAGSIRDLVAAIPDTWTNDRTMRTDVMFLLESVDDPDVIDLLPIREQIDEAFYVPGAVVWRVDADNRTKSGKARLVGTDLYRAMTVRNCNTVRKLGTLLDGPTAG